jgi:hypothetical protein
MPPHGAQAPLDSRFRDLQEGRKISEENAPDHRAKLVRDIGASLIEALTGSQPIADECLAISHVAITSEVRMRNHNPDSQAVKGRP